jgi:6-phosphogluconolactonase
VGASGKRPCPPLLLYGEQCLYQLMRLFVGTYTSGLGHVRGFGEGIHTCDLDPVTGLIRSLSVAKADNPSYLALHPSRAFLYAANETVSDPAAADDVLSAFRVASDTGELSLLNMASSRGRAPCHISVDPTGRFLLSANYGSGTFVSHRIEIDGRLGPVAGEIRNAGSGRDPVRQQGPHAHSLVTAPSGVDGLSFVAGCDLGLDTVFIFGMDATTGGLRSYSAVAVEPGSGPRHIEFDLPGRHAYVLTEMTARVCVFDWVPAEGRLVQKQAVSVLMDQDPGPRQGTEARLSPDGRHAYATNRGADCVACFGIDAVTGELAPLFRERLPGKTPRHTAFSPGGECFLVACQDSHEVLVYRRQSASGTLNLLASNHIASPACLVF